MWSMSSAHTGTVGIVTADRRGHLAALIGEEGKQNGPCSGIEWPAQGSCEPDAFAGGPGDYHGAGWLL